MEQNETERKFLWKRNGKKQNGKSETESKHFIESERNETERVENFMNEMGHR